MPTARILLDTWAKQSTVAAAMLKPEFRLEFKKGQSVEYLEWSPKEAGHISVKLKAPVAGYQSWLFFDEHIHLPDEDKEIWLSVPYYSQRDNHSSEWWRQCNSSSHAMVLNFVKPGSVASDDDYIRRFVEPVGDTTDWGVHGQALRRFGVESAYRQDLGFDDLERSLKAGYPVAIGVYHRGSLDAPSGGHVLVICGMKPGAFLAQDPWGAPFSYSNHNGRKVEIPISPSLVRRWLADGDNTGWGRLITVVDGKKTGL